MSSNLNPGWSVDSHNDFVLLKLDLTGSTVTHAFGYGTNAGGSEDSQAFVYLEAEGAAVVTFRAASERY